MVSKSKQKTPLTISELTKRANSSADARMKLDEYYKLEKAGGRPTIWYSEFNGYTIEDRNKLNPRVST